MSQPIPIDKISPREKERLRPADPDEVAKIVVSMRKYGQLHPVTVYRSPNEAKGAHPYVLVAGLHRLTAARQMGWEEITATIVSAAEAKAIQVEENLCRADLSALDRAIAVREWRAVWEAENGEIPLAGGRPAKNCDKLAQFSSDMLGGSWSERLADQMGCSRRAIMRSNKIAQIDGDLIELMRGTATADNQSRLLKIADAEPKTQSAIVSTVTGGGTDIEEAIDQALNPASTPTEEERADKELETSRARWLRLDNERQDELLRFIGVERLRQFMQRELADEA